MKALSPTVPKVLKRLHDPLEMMLVYVRWYVAYPMSLRNLEEGNKRVTPVSGGIVKGGSSRANGIDVPTWKI
jgi:hypothetical protein